MLVILDRDGVINYDSVEYIKSPEEWLPIPGSLKAVAELNRAEHTVVVATNQSGIARGYYTHDILGEIHAKMHRCLAEVDGFVDGIYYCPHHPEVCCACRKPQPGLLQQIAEDFPTEFSQAVMVGDSLTDIEVARRMGCQPILVETGNGRDVVNAGVDLQDVKVFSNLAAVVDALL